MDTRPTAILVTTYPGQAGFAELERLAATGRRPRREYVRLAEEFDRVVVVDDAHLRERGHPLARRLARLSLPLAQVAEAYLRRRRFAHIVALSDRIGLPLALLFKLTRSRRDLVLVADWLTPPKKAVFLRRLKVQSHLKAIVQTDPLQQRKARDELGVDPSKLVLLPWASDTRFWRPEPGAGDAICAVGWEQRDYATLIAAVRDLPVEVNLAVGTMVFSPPEAAAATDGSPGERGRRVAFDRFAALRSTTGYRVQSAWLSGGGDRALPGNVVVHTQLDPIQLRSLYARSRFVVLPLHDVDYDVGATAVTEAMAMGRAVVLSAIAGQTGYVRDGEDGLYVPPGDAGALRAAIVYLLDHPDEARAMGQAARRRAEECFSIDGFATRLGRVVSAP